MTKLLEHPSSRDGDHICQPRIVPDITIVRVIAALSCAVTTQGAHVMNRKTQWMIGILASALAGCATAPSGVVTAEQDAYHVNAFGAR